ncbi:hypothetical protein MKX03_000968 [Papaver bracteatum]|nr:hypothetical protein MKX03_000968 [Papaver bracteatum]
MIKDILTTEGISEWLVKTDVAVEGSSLVLDADVTECGQSCPSGGEVESLSSAVLGEIKQLSSAVGAREKELKDRISKDDEFLKSIRKLDLGLKTLALPNDTNCHTLGCSKHTPSEKAKDDE